MDVGVGIVARKTTIDGLCACKLTLIVELFDLPSVCTVINPDNLVKDVQDGFCWRILPFPDSNVNDCAWWYRGTEDIGEGQGLSALRRRN